LAGNSNVHSMGVWASGMLSALGAGGPWFDPALAPPFSNPQIISLMIVLQKSTFTI
jgi:hypothetical protein